MSDEAPTLFYAIYWRYFSPCASEADTFEEARSLLEYGEDNGDLSSVGVYDVAERRLTVVNSLRRYADEERKTLRRALEDVPDTVEVVFNYDILYSE